MNIDNSTLLNKKINRRKYLLGSVYLAGTLKLGSAISALAPSQSWAVTLNSLSNEQAETLILFIKQIYPQKKFGDEIYALSVKDIDKKIQKDKIKAKIILSGIDELNKIKPFKSLDQKSQLDLVSSLENSAFFQMVRSDCSVSLYDNPLAYMALGYEGESFTKGGYLNRGFNDITWLPDSS